MKKTDFIRYCKANNIDFNAKDTKEILAIKIINFNVSIDNKADCFGCYSSLDTACDFCAMAGKCMQIKNKIA